jgi:hypothetical protein
MLLFFSRFVTLDWLDRRLWVNKRRRVSWPSTWLRDGTVRRKSCSRESSVRLAKITQGRALSIPLSLPCVLIVCAFSLYYRLVWGAGRSGLKSILRPSTSGAWVVSWRKCWTENPCSLGETIITSWPWSWISWGHPHWMISSKKSLERFCEPSFCLIDSEVGSSSSLGVIDFFAVRSVRIDHEITSERSHSRRRNRLDNCIRMRQR